MLLSFTLLTFRFDIVIINVNIIIKKLSKQIEYIIILRNFNFF